MSNRVVIKGRNMLTEKFIDIPPRILLLIILKCLTIIYPFFNLSLQLKGMLKKTTTTLTLFSCRIYSSLFYKVLLIQLGYNYFCISLPILFGSGNFYLFDFCICSFGKSVSYAVIFPCSILYELFIS